MYQLRHFSRTTLGCATLISLVTLSSPWLVAGFTAAWVALALYQLSIGENW